MAKNTRSNVYEGGVTADPSIGPGVPGTIGAILPRVGTTELWQKFGALDTEWFLLNTAADRFPPFRVAIVDPFAGNDLTGSFGGLGGNPFQTISGALAAAPALIPTAANPLAIWIAPGTYNEPLDMVSNCHLSAYPGTRGSVTVLGQPGWLAGQGVNLPQAADTEVLAISGINFSTAFAFQRGGKPAGSTLVDITNCQAAGMGDTCRVAGDVSRITNTVFSGAFGVENGGHNYIGCTFAAMTVQLAADVNMNSLSVTGAITVNNTAVLRLNQCDVFGAITANIGTTVRSSGGRLSGVITSNAGAIVDIRGTEYVSQANLTGLGPIDRTIARFTTTLVQGNNPLLFAGLGINDFLDGLYAVSITPLTPAVPSTALVPATKTGTGFTVFDSAGGTHEFLITKE